jgi:hypothetical protein
MDNMYQRSELNPALSSEELSEKLKIFNLSEKEQYTEDEADQFREGCKLLEQGKSNEEVTAHFKASNGNSKKKNTRSTSSKTTEEPPMSEIKEPPMPKFVDNDDVLNEQMVDGADAQRAVGVDRQAILAQIGDLIKQAGGMSAAELEQILPAWMNLRREEVISLLDQGYVEGLGELLESGQLRKSVQQIMGAPLHPGKHSLLIEAQVVEEESMSTLPRLLTDTSNKKLSSS